MTDMGTFTEIDGRAAVRFIRTYQHPVERVWAAVTTPDGLCHWFPSQVEIDLRPGGDVIFLGDPHTEDRRGRVLACEPPYYLALTWGDDEPSVAAGVGSRCTTSSSAATLLRAKPPDGMSALASSTSTLRGSTPKARTVPQPKRGPLCMTPMLPQVCRLARPSPTARPPPEGSTPAASAVLSAARSQPQG